MTNSIEVKVYLVERRSGKIIIYIVYPNGESYWLTRNGERYALNVWYSDAEPFLEETSKEVIASLAAQATKNRTKGIYDEYVVKFHEKALQFEDVPLADKYDLLNLSDIGFSEGESITVAL